MFFLILAWVFFLALRGKLPTYAAFALVQAPGTPSSTNAGNAGLVGGADPSLGATPSFSLGGLLSGLGNMGGMGGADTGTSTTSTTSAPLSTGGHQ